MKPEILKIIIEKHQMLCALAYNSEGTILAEAGNLNDEKLGDLISALIGPYGDVKNTFASLEGQLLPRIWGQGDTYAYIHKPKDDLMVITFGSGKIDTKSNYRKSKEIDTDLIEAIK